MGEGRGCGGDRVRRGGVVGMGEGRRCGGDE